MSSPPAHSRGRTHLSTIISSPCPADLCFAIPGPSTQTPSQACRQPTLYSTRFSACKPLAASIHLVLPHFFCKLIIFPFLLLLYPLFGSGKPFFSLLVFCCFAALPFPQPHYLCSSLRAAWWHSFGVVHSKSGFAPPPSLSNQPSHLSPNRTIQSSLVSLVCLQNFSL